jgi:hypothetical protein
MNNLLLYCGLIDEKIRAPDKDLPVLSKWIFVSKFQNFYLGDHFKKKKILRISICEPLYFLKLCLILVIHKIQWFPLRM